MATFDTVSNRSRSCDNKNSQILGWDMLIVDSLFWRPFVLQNFFRFVLTLAPELSGRRFLAFSGVALWTPVVLETAIFLFSLKTSSSIIKNSGSAVKNINKVWCLGERAQPVYHTRGHSSEIPSCIRVATRQE